MLLSKLFPLPRLPPRITFRRSVSKYHTMAPKSVFHSAFAALPTLPDTDSSRIALDGFRTAIAEYIVSAFPEKNISLEKVYNSVDYGKKGIDFTVAIPRLGLTKGEKGKGKKDKGKKKEEKTSDVPKAEETKEEGMTVDDVGKYFVNKFSPTPLIASISHDQAFLHFMLNTRALFHIVLGHIYCLTNKDQGGWATDIAHTNYKQKIASSVPKNSEEKIPEEPLTIPYPLTTGYGTSTSGVNKRIIIEYSSPNIAKSFHVGHLRSTIIGAFLSNLYSAFGWEVIRMNYLGDWGTQFGLIAYGFEKYGSQEKLEKDAISHLLEVYVKVNKDAETDPTVKAQGAEWFKRMEDGDPVALGNWKKWRDLSIEKYKVEYEGLGVEFDVYTGESEVSNEMMDTALKRLEDMGLVKDAETGGKIVDLEKYKLGSAVVRKKDGTSIYLTRDIGGAIQRYEQYKFDKMIYVVASQQDLHLAQFFQILRLLGYEWADPSRLQHVNYGLVQGMSTRKGTVVFLRDIINEAATTMHEQMKQNPDKYDQIESPEETAREIGVTGVKIQDMSAKRINNYTFSWDRMLSFEGDTGPYLQYAHVRLCSLGRKNVEVYPLPSPSSPLDTDFLDHLLSAVEGVDGEVSSPEEEAAAREIVLILSSYPDILKTAMRTHEPSGVVHYGFKLAHAISSAWDTLPVKTHPNVDTRQARMFLYECTREVLGRCMAMIGVRSVGRM